MKLKIKHDHWFVKWAYFWSNSCAWEGHSTNICFLFWRGIVLGPLVGLLGFCLVVAFFAVIAVLLFELWRTELFLLWIGVTAAGSVVFRGLILFLGKFGTRDIETLPVADVIFKRYDDFKKKTCTRVELF